MENNTDQTAQLAALLAQMQASGASVSPAPGGWAKPMPIAANPSGELQGVSIPISIRTPMGKIRVYLNFPGNMASSQDALMSLLETLAANNYPLDAWVPKPQGGYGGGGNRGGNGGDWGRN